MSLEKLKEIGKTLAKRSGRAVFMTLSENGVLVCQDERAEHIAAAPVRPAARPGGGGRHVHRGAGRGAAAGASPYQLRGWRRWRRE